MERGQRRRDGRPLKSFLSIPVASSHGILWAVCVVCLPETQREGITWMCVYGYPHVMKLDVGLKKLDLFNSDPCLS